MIGYNNRITLIKKNEDNVVAIEKTYNAMVEIPSINQKKYNRANYNLEIKFRFKIPAIYELKHGYEYFIRYNQETYLVLFHQPIPEFNVTVFDKKIDKKYYRIAYNNKEDYTKTFHQIEEKQLGDG